LHGSRPVYLVGLAETDVLDFLLSHARPGTVFYDLGANVGFFSLAVGRAVGPTGRVYAFEPAPYTADALRYNLRLNGLEHAEVVQAAVSDHAATVAFATVGESHQHAHVTDERSPDAIDVPAITLDDFVRDGARPPDLIKIDIEGHEDAAIDGMTETLRTHRPVVLCEIHQTVHVNDHKVERVLRDCGYRCQWLEPGMSRDALWWVPHVVAEPMSI
jgi:FkbM family methyltransferase